jgi:hypothetical protein
MKKLIQTIAVNFIFIIAVQASLLDELPENISPLNLIMV